MGASANADGASGGMSELTKKVMELLKKMLENNAAQGNQGAQAQSAPQQQTQGAQAQQGIDDAINNASPSEIVKMVKDFQKMLKTNPGLINAIAQTPFGTTLNNAAIAANNTGGGAGGIASA